MKMDIYPLLKTVKISQREIYEDTIVLTQFLINIGVTKETAVEDACRVEHYISDETFDALKNYFKISAEA